jgi:hypothetical protein
VSGSSPASNPGLEILDEPGVVALIGRSTDALDGHVLVTHDRAFELLARRLPALFARMTYVFDAADARLMSDAGVPHDPMHGDVCDDLDSIPELSLPAGLSPRTVGIRAGD